MGALRNGCMLLVVCLLAFAWVGKCQETVPAVRLAVQTSWEGSSLLYEAAEFLGDIDSALFFSFVQKHSELYLEREDFETAEEEYKYVMDICREVLFEDEKWLKLLEFALASRHYSARVEMHR